MNLPRKKKSYFGSSKALKFNENAVIQNSHIAEVNHQEVTASTSEK